MARRLATSLSLIARHETEPCRLMGWVANTRDDGDDGPSREHPSSHREPPITGL